MADFDKFLTWGLAWGGFAWGCEAGVYLMRNIKLHIVNDIKDMTRREKNSNNYANKSVVLAYMRKNPKTAM